MLKTKTLYFQSPLRLYMFPNVWLSTPFFFRRSTDGALLFPPLVHWPILAQYAHMSQGRIYALKLPMGPNELGGPDAWERAHLVSFPSLSSFFPLPAYPGSSFFINAFHTNPSPSVCSWSSPSEMVLQQIWEATPRVSSCHICFTHWPQRKKETRILVHVLPKGV